MPVVDDGARADATVVIVRRGRGGGKLNVNVACACAQNGHLVDALALDASANHTYLKLNYPAVIPLASATVITVQYSPSSINCTV